MAVPVDGILVVHPRIALLEQQLEQSNGGVYEPRGPSPSAQHLHLGSSPVHLCKLSCTGDLL